MFNIARLKACSYCGKIHSGTCDRPKKDYHVKQDRVRNFRKSSEWKRCRVEILERDKYCCQICLQQGHINASKSLHVHHIIPLVNNWDLRTDEHNLISLCEEHHHDVHNGLFNTTDIQDLVNSKYE